MSKLSFISQETNVEAEQRFNNMTEEIQMINSRLLEMEVSESQILSVCWQPFVCMRKIQVEDARKGFSVSLIDFVSSQPSLSIYRHLACSSQSFLYSMGNCPLLNCKKQLNTSKTFQIFLKSNLLHFARTIISTICYELFLIQEQTWRIFYDWTILLTHEVAAK